MGRWKMGPQGGYWDGQDSGPDQMTPTPEMMQAAGQGPVAGPVPPAGQPGGFHTPDGGGFTGGIDVMRMKWEAMHPGVPFPGVGASPTPNDGAIIPDFPRKGSPVDLTPGEGGQWGMGGQMYDFQSLLDAMRNNFGGQQPLVAKAVNGGMGGAVGSAGGALGGAVGGLFGGLFGGGRKPAPSSSFGAAPQSVMSSMLRPQRDQNDSMNLGALGGAK